MANVIFVVARLLSASALCVQRQVSISDLGHDDDWRGWYDLRGCGEGQCWDYCRWVGSNGSQGDPRLTTGSAHNNSSKWTCVLGNETDVDTVWDRWGTVWPTGLYSTRCPSQRAQARTDAPTDVPTEAARRAQATQEAAPTLAPTLFPSETPTPAALTVAPTPLPTKTPTPVCGMLENNAGAPLPNMPIETISSCDCRQKCRLDSSCKAWTYSAGMYTVSGKNCWLRQAWAGVLNDCGADCWSGVKAAPTLAPTPLPTETPTPAPPTLEPTPLPTETPTLAPPTSAPSPLPTETPTLAAPTVAPTPLPTKTPTPAPPTLAPTPLPTQTPTPAAPKAAPTPLPTKTPTPAPPTLAPTPLPTETPTAAPTVAPTPLPTKTPTPAPPTLAPTPLPTETPTAAAPTAAPTPLPTKTPTPAAPTLAPTPLPTETPTPAAPTVAPTPLPTVTQTPAAPTLAPTPLPTETPTPAPTVAPTPLPTGTPTPAPPTMAPTPLPTETPTPAAPTVAPTPLPTGTPTPAPTQSPTQEPTESPTAVPTFTPTQKPTWSPTAVPTVSPTAVPTQKPPQKPTESPTAVPTCTPNHQPTESPTGVRTQKPTQEPTGSPTAVLTQMPTQMQTREPTALPTALPTFTPTHEPTTLPTSAPSFAPTLRPTKSPTNTSNGEPLLLQHFIDALVEERTAQVMDFIASNETRAVSKIGDTVLVVQKLSLTEAVGGMVPVKSEGGTEVAVPTSVLEQLGGEVIFAVAEFKLDTCPFADDDSTQTSVDRPKVRVTGVVELGIADPKTGETVVVENLDPPLIFTLGVNRTDQAVCAFFDEVLQKWSTEGISLEQSSVGSKLRCATTHLSFFGSIVEGMLKTLACSNFNLLTSLGYAEFACTEWCSDIGALLLWIFLFLILVLFVIAIALDYYRYHASHGWRDEYFLFPGEGPEMHVLDDDSPSRTFLQTHGCCLPIICVVICSVGSVFLEPLVEIVEEMIAEMLGDFWYIYSTLKNIFSTLEGMRQCSTVTVVALLLNFGEALSCSSALRVAGGHTWRDVEDMELVKEGLELLEATEVRRHGGAYVESEVEFTMEIDAERSNEEVSFRENAHYNRIRKRLAHFDGHVSSIARSHSTIESSLIYCEVSVMIFLNELPVFRIFFQSIGTPSSMRFLYFMLDISGMLMLTTMFTAGASRSRRSTAETQSEDVDSVDPCEIHNFEEQLGRVIVIGMAAAVLCVVPKTIISKLRSRKFRLIDSIGSSAWKKQLRVWCCRDIVTWILGIGYILWCVNISFIYVISVEPGDQFEWFVSIVTAVAEDGLVIPAVLAVCLPAIVRIFSMVLELSRLRVHADSSDKIEEGQRRCDSSGEIINFDAELRVACSEKKLQDPQEHEAAQHVTTASGVGPVFDVDTALEVIAMDRDNALMQDRRRLASQDIMEPREAGLASDLDTALEGIADVRFRGTGTAGLHLHVP